MVTVPSTPGEWLIWSTSQAMATVCIHVPVPETSCPVQNSAKFGTPRTLSMSFGRRRPAGGACQPLVSGPLTLASYGGAAGTSRGRRRRSPHAGPSPSAGVGAARRGGAGTFGTSDRLPRGES